MMTAILQLALVIVVGCTLGVVLIRIIEWPSTPHPHIPMRERMIRNRPTAYGDQLVEEQHEWERRQRMHGDEQWRAA